MPDLEYGIKPVANLRDEIEAAAAAWPLAPGTRLTPENVGGVDALWIDVEGSEAGALYLHAHGGGYYRGSARVDAAICSHLVAGAGGRCLSVNYRRPPDEGVFPAAVDDMVALWRSLLEGGSAPEKVVVGGTSAGGGLAAAFLLRLRDEKVPLPAAAILVSPWTDLTQSGESFRTNAAHGPSRDYLAHWAGVYLDGADPRHPEASPLFADLRALPPLLIQAGGDETMLDDATLFAAAAARAGVAVTLQVTPGRPHSFQHDVGRDDRAREAVDEMARFVRRHTGGAA